MSKVQKSKSATRSTESSVQTAMRSAATSAGAPLRLQAAGAKVSSTHDPEEKEADNTADKVMRMAVPDSQIAKVPTNTGGVFRKLFRRSAKPNKEEKISRKAPNEEPQLKEDKELQRKEDRELQRTEDKELQRKENEELQRKEDKELQRKENEELQRKEDEKLQRTEDKEHQRKEEGIQRAPEPDKEIARKPEQEQEPKIARKPQVEEQQLQRKAHEQQEEVQRKAEGSPDAGSNVTAEIRSAMAGGDPLPLSVRRFMEPRFNADFSNVKVHSNTQSANLNKKVSAKAFAVKNHIFFGKDQYQPESDEGKHLLAHELTHTIQQGAASQGDGANQGGGANVQRTAEDEVQRKVAVNQRTAPKVQRLGVRDALDYFADHANHIPGFRMFTIVLGVNPINMRSVDRTPANILRAVVEFMPGGAFITRALDNHGVFERVGNWVSQQLRSLAITGSLIRSSINRFLDSLSWRDIFNLSGVWQRAKRIFTEPIDRIKSFVRGLVNGIIQFVKDAILMPLARLASRTRGWDLLCAVLQRNPITGEPVARNAENLIGGFMTLIGQQEVWQNIKRANAIGRAWAWFQGALAGLLGFVRSIPSLFVNAFRALGIRDLLDVPGAFMRVARVFGSFIGRFFSWAGGTVMNLLQIIFEVVAPGAMPYLRRAGGAFRSIIRNPIGFIRNLVNAGKMGFRRFATNFLTHLRTSLVNWLTGTLGGTGVYIPQAFTPRELIKFVLSVLGLTWQNVRTKLVRAVGERAVTAMETGFELVRTLITEGPAAAWQKISEGLTNLREMVIEQIMNFVRSRIIQAAVTRLLSMLSPAGAFIQAIIGIYNTVMFFVERLRTIIQVGMSFVNSIMAIAAGRITAAAVRVERTMAGMLTLMISFLARIAGLGRVATVVTQLINRVRAPVDRALDRVVAWIVAQARRLGRFILQAGVPQDPQQRAAQGMNAAVAVVNRLPGNRIGEAVIHPALRAIKARYGFSLLQPELRGGRWWVIGEMSPRRAQQTQKTSTSAPAATAASALPDQVDILNASNAILIRNYSRSARTGTFQAAIFSSAANLSKLRHAPQAGQTGPQTVPAPAPANVDYTIRAANSLYGPPSAFQAVDRSDPDEAASYSRTREAFPEVMREWWKTEPAADAARITQLRSLGLVDIDPSGGLMRGASKWNYIYSQLTNAEKNRLAGPVNKDNMGALLDSFPASRRETLQTAWKQRWAQGTQIHHIKPVNFGGDNSNFIPLSAEKHVGSTGVHPRFWTPLKRFLMGLRS